MGALIHLEVKVNDASNVLYYYILMIDARNLFKYQHLVTSANCACVHAFVCDLF